MPEAANKLEFIVQPSHFQDQGKVGEFLIAQLGSVMQRDFDRAREAGLPEVRAVDELMAADDFYFSSVELMDCCIVARAASGIIGAACANPFTSTLHFLVVAPEWRRKGIGRRLLEGAKDILRKRGCAHIKIEYPAAEEFAAAEPFFAACAMPLTTRTITQGGRL